MQTKCGLLMSTMASMLGMGPVLSLPAQEIVGSIVGAVSDSSGAVLAGAKVSAVQETTSITAAGNGPYRFPALGAGRYRLIVEAPGLQRVERSGVILNTTEVLRIDFALGVGTIADWITVSTQTPLLQSEKVTLRQTVEREIRSEVPLATHNFTHILGLNAGVTSAIFAANNPAAGNRAANVNGARAGSNHAVVEDITSTHQLTNQASMEASPSLEFMCRS